MKIYVGTYAKYNNASLYGEWLDLEDYSTIGDFYDACKELHDDEDDPEFMFQDWEEIPSEFIGESWVSPAVFELLQMNDSEKELVLAYMEVTGAPDSFDDLLTAAQDALCGQYGSIRDYAEEYMDSCYEIPSFLESYIDYDAFARDLAMDHTYSNGYVFRDY